jgi:hypothetical protein
MSDEIKSLIPVTETPPKWWTTFLDATSPPAFSYMRIVGFAVITVFLSVWAYLSLTTGTVIIPSKEWVYILVAFSLSKPIQRFAETKDNESQLNYDFQMAQLTANLTSSKTTTTNP